jgi:hypothetical protein
MNDYRFTVIATNDKEENRFAYRGGTRTKWRDFNDIYLNQALGNYELMTKTMAEELVAKMEKNEYHIMSDNNMHPDDDVWNAGEFNNKYPVGSLTIKVVELKLTCIQVSEDVEIDEVRIKEPIITGYK